MRLAFCCLILAVSSMSAVAHADDVQLYAAGSLRAALTDVGVAFTGKTGYRVVAKFGPSGVLEKAIAGGAKADVFASANMEYPQALNRSNKSGPVLRFARNKLCALVKPGLAVDSTTLLDRMLDPAIKLGTSTPNSDPSGDYAFEVFRKADAIRPGARAVLESKALKLTGTTESAMPPAGLPSMAGTLPKAAPTFSSPTAPPRPKPTSNIRANRSSNCPRRSRSAPTTA
jgi:molybdate transport system substrate-binding protein